MTTNTTEGIQSYSHETDGSIREIVTSFVDEVADALVQAGASQNAVQAVQESGEGLASSVEQIEQDAAQAHSRARKAEARVEELEEQINSEREERTLDVAKDRQRLTEVEQRLEDVEGGEEHTTAGTNPTPETVKDGSTTPETPLERVCAFDEETAERELTANQSRARFIARDITDYCDKVPAGFSLRSGDIATVLRAGTDCRGRTQTVARVMDFLSDLGGDGVEIVERRGTKRVVFSEETARRVEQISSQPSAAANHGVVMGGGV